MDIRIENHGSVVLIRALTKEAEYWIEEYLPDDMQWWCGACAVEPRYVKPILAGMESAGLEIEA